MLRNQLFSAEQVAAIVRDFHTAGLEPAEVAMMAFAQKITREADQITSADIENLRSHGFDDEEILEIVLTAAARNLYSKALDALGAEPDSAYLELEEDLRQALVVGRPFA